MRNQKLKGRNTHYDEQRIIKVQMISASLKFIVIVSFIKHKLSLLKVENRD